MDPRRLEKWATFFVNQADTFNKVASLQYLWSNMNKVLARCTVSDNANNLKGQLDYDQQINCFYMK